MADLTCKIENIIVAANQIIHAMFVANICDVHPYSALISGDVEQLAAVLRDEGIDDGDDSAHVSQAPGKVAADEAEAARDENRARLECGGEFRHEEARVVGDRKSTRLNSSHHSISYA